MRFSVLACVLLSGFLPAMAETFTTVDVARRSLQSNCLDWKIVGVCLWLHCKYGRCRINTTPRVSHYLPDLVFTAYDHTGFSPWTELRALLPGVGNLLQGGSFPSTETADQHYLRFKEVDAIGHPFPLRRKVFNVVYLCRSQAKPMFPYFISVLDHAEWRGGLESARPESLTPGLREIGDWPRYSWGSVFPVLASCCRLKMQRRLPLPCSGPPTS
ncbi:MAG: TraU family protein [Gammaproteobacteria bacterium]|nr:TraU family protein [Gammaproteobacteria bacterium]